MSPTRPPKKSDATKPPAAISAAEFPALRTFLRGYLHQDMKDEYGSVAEAARRFSADASLQERAAVAAEWSNFLNQTGGQPLHAINAILTGPLGSSYSLTAQDVRNLSAIFSQSEGKPGN
jgi:CdiI immunity protein